MLTGTSGAKLSLTSFGSIHSGLLTAGVGLANRRSPGWWRRALHRDDASQFDVFVHFGVKSVVHFTCIMIVLQQAVVNNIRTAVVGFAFLTR